MEPKRDELRERRERRRKVFTFEETWKTHEIMENGKAGGKMVVVVDSSTFSRQTRST
jgi:hypothetical protein